MLELLKPRGEVEEVSIGDGLLAGTQRLRIVDADRAVQPWSSADGRWLLCYNGEIFNYRSLRAELAGLGRRFRTEGDTEVVLEAFAQWGEAAVGRFRGEFAFAIADRAAGRVYLARDQVGVKPLYWSVRGGCLHVASEIKALVPVAAPVSQVPPGWHGWADAGQAPALVPYSDLLSRPDGLAPVDDPEQAAALVRAALKDSIAARVDTRLTVGVIVSGGLDSSLVLRHVHALHPDCVAVTVGAPGSEDLCYARRLAAELGVRHEVIEIAPHRIRLTEIKEAIRIAELTEYGDIINAVVSVPLFRRIASLGIKVVLTGDGSDELFGGYPMYDQVSQVQQRRLFLHKIANLGRTELQRVDRVSMAHGVETRVPFLDPALVDVAMRLPMSLKVRDGTEKWILRQAFTGELPDYIRQRPKNPLSYSSGLHERARLYKPLFARIHRSFGYDLHDPVRRDFSVLLERCGNDLDLALAQIRARTDYSTREHARDLIGAARWNATALVGRG
ncbi:MAG TPA: asparagine synthase-related protein [Streptosporangiaceae bacterium]|nr:asparagine synthase-related protein [Streptosporangiaceae bacterium]